MEASQPAEKIVAFVLYPGLTPLDIVGALQVFTSLNKVAPQFRPVVVAERIEPMGTDLEFDLIADKTFAEVPHPDIIVVPGGVQGTLQAMRNPTLLAYVRTAAESAEIVASVCTGSLILASAGLLGDRPSTTHWVAAGMLNNFGARYQTKRWVEDGKFIMAAGVSAGIDMALYLVARLTDQETMRTVQLDIEYDPQPPFGRIDVAHLDRVPRTIRSVISLAAPLLTRRSKQLSKQAGWS